MPPRIALAPDPHGPGGRLQPLDEAGAPLGPPAHTPDLAAAVALHEADSRPRWVWAATDGAYAPLLAKLPGRVARCHDLRLVEALLLTREGRFGQPRSLGAAWARLRRLPVPADLPESTGPEDQDTLFAPDRLQLPPATDALEAVVAVHADQQRRIQAATEPADPAVAGPTAAARLRLLAAAESAGALVAAEMAYDGLPWRSDVHDELLTELLGPRPHTPGAQPRRLAELTAELQQALGGRPFNPDSHTQVLRAFADQGVHLGSTRSWELRGIDHPAAALLIRYKELSRIHAAHGWAWQDAWARGGRFRPEYVVGGVVSGRWASRGGGALQIPRILRGAVVADPGWLLVVADAAQLEPRVLAALSQDAGLARSAAEGDLYAALAATAFQGDRAKAKLGLLGAMYGQTSGDIGPLLATLRRRYPVAMGYVESAARTGEDGGVVGSRLGRVCPPPSSDWLDLTEDPDSTADTGGRSARARGRFTRNFVIQASAADWALALLAALRRRLAALESDPDERPHLVFFQHDEVVVHTPANLADQVAAAVEEAAEEARALVFGDTPVRFPLTTAVVDRYADAK